VSAQQRSTTPALFKLGRVVSTPGALEALREARTAPRELLRRHQQGDWGAVPKEDARENERSVREGFRILSSYPLSTGATCWILTEADRSVTTILKPEDY
jgi:hypothetical protein